MSPSHYWLYGALGFVLVALGVWRIGGGRTNSTVKPAGLVIGATDPDRHRVVMAWGRVSRRRRNVLEREVRRQRQIDLVPGLCSEGDALARPDAMKDRVPVSRHALGIV